MKPMSRDPSLPYVGDDGLLKQGRHLDDKIEELVGVSLNSSPSDDVDCAFYCANVCGLFKTHMASLFYEGGRWCIVASSGGVNSPIKFFGHVGDGKTECLAICDAILYLHECKEAAKAAEVLAAAAIKTNE